MCRLERSRDKLDKCLIGALGRDLSFLSQKLQIPAISAVSIADSDLTR
jgi:hypothetical protein